MASTIIFYIGLLAVSLIFFVSAFYHASCVRLTAKCMTPVFVLVGAEFACLHIFLASEPCPLPERAHRFSTVSIWLERARAPPHCPTLRGTRSLVGPPTREARAHACRFAANVACSV
jgi:hypothetical protein